ncbi:MAG TPA: hypothetical protein VLV50_10665 [Stellaceae bacterium]|nr:hypothetical protein [Stellaceae bacterium]
MGNEPSFEDAVTTGMHTIADGIARSIDTALDGALLRWLARLFGLAPARTPEPPPSL